MSRVDKFNYLKSLLAGPAASAIAGFALTAENYDAAIAIEVIVSSHMEALVWKLWWTRKLRNFVSCIIK